jgi:hypothetical protein
VALRVSAHKTPYVRFDWNDYSAHFSDRGRPFQADRGRGFSVIVDDHGGAGATTVS